MSLLDPWRQARADIIASRPTYTPFYTPGDYAVTVGNPDTGMVDQVSPEVLPQVVQRQNEVMDDGRIDDMQPLSDPRTVFVEPRPDQKLGIAAVDRFPTPAQPGLLDEPNNPGYGMTYGTGQGPVNDYAQEDLTSYYEAAPGPVGGYGVPGAMTMDMESNQTPTEVAAPTTMGIGYTPGGVTYDESGRAYAPALDPRDEPPSLLENLGFIASKDTRGGGQYDKLGQSLLDPATQEARGMRDNAALISRAFPGGTLFSHMISNSRAGNLSEVGPYSRDAQGNYRFGARGPMGTLMAPVGSLMDNNDFSGRYGLGTVGNTGISATPSMFDAGGQYKGGAFGYGLGFKNDGTFGSLNAVDANDQQGIDDQMGRAGFEGDDTGTATGTTAMGDTYSASGMTGGIEDYFGDDGGGDDGGGGCVIATHGVKTGGFSERDKAVAEVWCQKKYHGKWWGELFRKGYQYLGNRAIEAGKAAKYYGEFKAFIAYGRGLKPGLKHAINYYLRTVQFFATGAALTGVEQFQKLRKKINDLRNR